MVFYTVVLRQSAGYWVALCLENVIVGQEKIPEDAISQLKQAIESFEDVYDNETNIYKAPISREELHEVLMLDDKEQNSEIYESRKVYA
ncbi:type II toxin-antitoxin system HicB family antitoxin [Chlorogloeopsis fritschii PCC 9212]|uniref:DUF1902 domain-containing protein n=1 Tax=Chlorogloeopsis fritschii PCC 6912 TaxID=211165 RepID=A0A433MW09_CHLFR|nr:hypothetical protein [Chlorogloeopsis fritschii]RUR72099.1 hypothetical protein PCC6912_65100 [Chlorogloeopsis fritschii PCC 6912]